MDSIADSVDILAVVGLILVVSQLGGRLANLLGAPRVTGYLLMGLLLGPSLLGLVSEARVDDLDVLVDVALAVIAFLIGGSLRWRRVRPLGKVIFGATMGETVGAFLLSALATVAVLPAAAGLDYSQEVIMGVAIPAGLVVGALSAASAPAAILAIVHEYRADGPLSRTLLGVVAIDDAVAIVLFALMSNTAVDLAVGGGFTFQSALVAPATDVGVSVTIGVIAGVTMQASARLLPGRDTLLAVTLGMVLLVGGLAESTGGSLLLADMALGVTVANIVRRQERLFRTVESVEELVFGAFFLLAGAHLDLSVLGTAGLLGAALLLSRFAGKLAGAAAGAWAVQAPEAVRRWLGLTLLPQAGVAVGLVLRIRDTGIGEEIFELLLAGVLAAVLVNELVTPFTLRFALRRAGEIDSGAGPAMTKIPPEASKETGHAS